MPIGTGSSLNFESLVTKAIQNRGFGFLIVSGQGMVKR